jgi:hypothetical protein
VICDWRLTFTRAPARPQSPIANHKSQMIFSIP